MGIQFIRDQAMEIIPCLNKAAASDSCDGVLGFMVNGDEWRLSSSWNNGDEIIPAMNTINIIAAKRRKINPLIVNGDAADDASWDSPSADDEESGSSFSRVFVIIKAVDVVIGWIYHDERQIRTM